MLKLVQIEFCKLRRKKLIWLMLLSAFVMPFFAFLYYGYLGQTNIDPRLFYKWSALGYTIFIILPFILGLFGTMLMHDEKFFFGICGGLAKYFNVDAKIVRLLFTVTVFVFSKIIIAYIILTIVIPKESKTY